MPGVIDASPRSTDPATGEPTDDAVLVALAKRDYQAFAPLYLRYADPVYRYCYRRLGNSEAAADATSQVFAKALAALPGCRETAFRAWLFAIAHNILIDTYRARSPDAPLDTAMEVIDPAPSPEDLALVAEERGRVRRLLGQLTADQRQVVELRLAGLTSNEIGAVLGRSRAAVDGIQFRAVGGLRALLGPGERSTEGRDAAR